ncbi:conserved hypothetical protein [Talaromyces stipitatus ATCC 10500]|uniref:BTB domain-containing protein n=1 Tax=Talaromyces stipitatus (strain ATCC 10500 / CBS 375.48 / QM 6759 / NRRL 1006) TaxID=441959 RepID=B8MMN5_TALSN|nr:uncharacterized protein TSTA_100340 [Talaromyces stipitatus ATCC 10500]EED13789.1 conserved hypothetical protein [Talaromyces stipitatus ATCC 10500]
MSRLSSDFRLNSDILYSEFLSSDIITLATENSERTFKIHRALLESKTKGVFGRLDKFKEGTENIYRFQDTSDNTLLRFIEWAYRGDYPENIAKPSLASTNPTLASSSSDNDTTTAEDPLSCHIQVYIFAHVYGISRLGLVAYDRITDRLRAINKPKDGKVKLQVISLMDLAFKKIHRGDRLLTWLGNYASFCLSELRVVSEFQKVVEEAPSLSLAMLKYNNPASVAPWSPDPGPNSFSGFGSFSASNGLSSLSSSSASTTLLQNRNLFGRPVSPAPPAPPGSIFGPPAFGGSGPGLQQ